MLDKWLLVCVVMWIGRKTKETSANKYIFYLPFCVCRVSCRVCIYFLCSSHHHKYKFFFLLLVLVQISQVLGHNEHLYVKFPKGVWNWQAFLSAMLFVQALLILFFPRQASQLKLLGIQRQQTQQQDNEEESWMTASKYYAVALLGTLHFYLTYHKTIKQQKKKDFPLIIVQSNFRSFLNSKYCRKRERERESAHKYFKLILPFLCCVLSI